MRKLQYQIKYIHMHIVKKKEHAQILYEMLYKN